MSPNPRAENGHNNEKEAQVQSQERERILTLNNEGRMEGRKEGRKEARKEGIVEEVNYWNTRGTK